MSQTEGALSTEPGAEPGDTPSSEAAPWLIVGVDGSAPSRRAVEFAAKRAVATGERLLLIHIIDEPTYSFTSPQENERRPAERREEIKRSEEGLRPLLQRAAELGAEVQGMVRHGHPAQSLAKLATAYDAGHIIVGRTGEGRVRTLLFGSTPSHLIQMADVPVTVVP